MEEYVKKSVEQHNRGEETAWYEAMSFVQEDSLVLTDKGSPPQELFDEVEDEFNAIFDRDVASRLRQCALRWGSKEVGGGASAKGGGGAADGSGDIEIDIASSGFVIQEKLFSFWCDDEHLGATLAEDPTGTTVWNSAMVLAKLLESGALGAPVVAGARVLELGCGVGLCGLAAARLGAASVMLTDAQKSTLDLLALNVAQERASGLWAADAKVDLNSWDWRKKPSRRVFGGKPEKGGGPYAVVLGSDLVYAATPMDLLPHLAGAVRQS